MTLWLIVLLIALLLALLAFGLVIQRARLRARRQQGEADPAAVKRQGARRGGSNRLGLIAQQAFAAMSSVLPDPRERYAAPLVLLAGDTGSGKTTMLGHSGLSTASAHGRGAGKDELAWHHFNQGVVLEVGASYLELDNLPDDRADAWDALGAQLQRYRPRRPLDSVVLTIGADTLGPATIEQLEQRAAQLQRRLADMQRLFGLRLPVYLMITKADTLAGFGDVACALPAGLRGAMLGWSNPYETGAPFDPAWVGQAFDAIGRSVAELRSETMAGERAPAAIDGFFQLPAAIDALRAPMQAFVARLMGASAYGETILLRGVYLCGDGAPPNAAPSLVFVRDFMANKVLAERGLAQPLRGQVLSRDKRVRRWRLATAVMVGLWLPALVVAGLRLGRVAPPLLDTLQTINEEQGERARARVDGASLPVEWYREASDKTLSGMLAHSSSLLSYAIPFSWHWFDRYGLDDRIDARFLRGLENVVYQSIRKGLNQRVGALTGTPLDPKSANMLDAQQCKSARLPAAGAFGPDTPLSGLAEFRNLDTYVDEVVALEHWLDVFARLQSKAHGNLEELGQLGAYTGAFSVSLTQGAVDATYFRHAINSAVDDAPLAPKGEYRGAVTCSYEARREQLYARLLDRHPLLLLSHGIDDKLHGSAEAKLANPAPLGAGSYEALQRELREITRWLAAPGAHWLHARRTEFGPQFTALSDKLARSELFGAARAASLASDAQIRLDRLETNLLEVSQAGGAVLQRNADASRLEMTPALAQLEQALSALMAQPFMAAPPEKGAHGVPAHVVMWDLNALNALLVMISDQQAYLAKSLGAFPASIQEELKAFADARLGARLVAGIDAAYTPASDPMAAWVRLGQAQKVLGALLDGLHKLGEPGAHDALAAALHAQAELALGGIDQEFAQSGVYLPREGGFAWWKGVKNPAAQGFAGGDPGALEDYLGAQHARVERSARLAAPLLRLYAASGGSLNAGLARRWDTIGRELERFTDKAPGARIAALHAYIRTDLAEMDMANCLDKQAPATASNAADFFAGRMRELGARIALRCAELAGGGASSAYAALATAFRRDLSNKFPFAPARRLDGMAAEPDDVAGFLLAYDKTGVQAQNAIGRLGADGQAARARGFLAATGRVRGFLAPLLPAPDGSEAAGYDVRVRFRVSERGDNDGSDPAGGEVDGNRIVAWSVQIGDQSVRFQNGEQGDAPALRWRIDTPVMLTLRWADNAPSVPRADENDPHMTVVGREVRYRFSEPWSLLRMLALYRVPTGRGETLGFEVPTAPALPAGAAPQPTGRARVFLRLALTPADKKDALAFPAFPIDAPGAEPSLIARPAMRSPDQTPTNVFTAGAAR